MKIQSVFLIAFASVMIGSTFAPAQAIGAKAGTYYVAVNGNDSWSGRISKPNVSRSDGPFATPEAACKAARRLGTEQSRRVIVQGGQYFLDKPLVLTDRDAGLSIESASGAKVCLYGGRNNRIEHNLIYHAMQELHDGAGIYCFAGKGRILRGNFIRDINDTGGYGASAYYLDERSENCLVEGNLSVGIVRPSHNHMAKNNTIRNNVFISDADVRLTFPKSSNYTVEKNIICAKGNIILENPDAVTALRNNVFFSAEGTVQCRKLKNYSRVGSYQLKAEDGNLLVDPLIVEFEKGTVRFAPDSPAGKLGIKPIDVSGAGRRPRENGE